MVPSAPVSVVVVPLVLVLVRPGEPLESMAVPVVAPVLVPAPDPDSSPTVLEQPTIANDRLDKTTTR